MITNNFRKLLRTLFVPPDTSTGIYLKNVFGENFEIDCGSLNYFGMSSAEVIVNSESFSKLQFNPGIFLGSGSKVATGADYTLTPITAGSVVSQFNHGTDDTGYPYGEMTIVYSNTTGGPVTINEVGLVLPLKNDKSQPYGKSYGQPVLLDRTVLTKVIVAAGETCTIKYRLTNQFKI